MAKVCLITIATVLACVALSGATPETAEHGSNSHRGTHYKGGIHNPVFDSEALFGSHISDQLDDLPQDVKLNRLRILAKSHDKNDDDIIDTEELTAWIVQSYRIMDHEEANERMKDDDENKDGTISVNEVIKKMFGYSEEEMEELEKKAESEEAEGKTEEEPKEEEDEHLENLRVIKEERRRFYVADVNKDGVLDKEEYVAFIQPSDFPHMHEIEIAKVMEYSDKDKDDFITLEEFIPADNVDDAEAVESDTHTFHNLDKNKDGKLSRDEVRPWALPDTAEIAHEEVQHLLKECDEDEDGKLTVEEIISKEEEFLGSATTDYGRYLHYVKDEL